ncbi:hypothetical protein OROGR_001412 [Orobanche gracilis]
MINFRIDGHVKCEKWIRDDDNGSKESKTTWWLKRLIGRTKKVSLDWPFPFAKNKLFHARKEVNMELMKEAAYFGDIVIVPYMDNYDLVVLETIAICEYGVRTVAAKYVMKCDDDTFVG